MELYYRRAETTHKSGRVVPSRVETVILFLPDVWRCVPTRLEWDSLHLGYKKQLERKLLRTATNLDDAEPAIDADEAAVADQKALPTTSHTISFLHSHIIFTSRYLYLFTFFHYFFVQLFLPRTPFFKHTHSQFVSRLFPIIVTLKVAKIERNK